MKAPEKYNWDPKWMLDHLIDLYLHLDSKTLAAALANDQRSFSVETFDDAANRMSSVLGRTSVDIQTFKALAQRAKEIDISNKKKDEDYDDAPDEFIGKDIWIANPIQL